MRAYFSVLNIACIRVSSRQFVFAFRWSEDYLVSSTWVVTRPTPSAVPVESDRVVRIPCPEHNRLTWRSCLSRLSSVTCASYRITSEYDSGPPELITDGEPTHADSDPQGERYTPLRAGATVYGQNLKVPPNGQQAMSEGARIADTSSNHRQVIGRLGRDSVIV